MFAIYKRELKAYFQTVIGWLFIAAILSLFGLYFYVYCFGYGYPYLASVLSSMSFIFLITIPILTMRILAEERKNKTDQLILTSPVSVGKIVLGKYLAMVTIYCITMAIVALIGLTLTFFGDDIPVGENMSAIFGFWLCGIACIAIGMFISSVTESQVIAAVLSFAALFLGYMMGNICGLISESGNWLTKVLGSYDIMKDMQNFYKGFFDLTGVIYYLSLAALFLFLTVQSIQKRRWSITGKKIGRGVFSGGFIAVVVVLVVAVNLVVSELPSTMTSFDVTSSQLFTMTEDAKEALKSLNKDVTIYVLEAEESGDTVLDKTLERFADSNSHITVEYKDPALYPTFYKAYTENGNILRNSLIIVSGERSRVVDYGDIYETEIDYQTYTESQTGYDGEGQLISAISFVTNDNMPVLYNITGHSELTLEESFTEAINKANITLTDIGLLTNDSIPEDAAGIIINAPQSDFSKDDAGKVINYLKKGGKAIIINGYVDASMENFESILAQYNISTAKGIVIEENMDNYYQNPLFLLPSINNNMLTENLKQNYIFVPYAQGMTYPEELPENVKIADLLITSDSAYIKSDMNTTTLERSDTDEAGQFSLGLTVSATEEGVDENTMMYVFSSSYLFTEDADSMVSGANLKLFTNILGELKSDELNSVIPVKSYAPVSITVSSSTALTVAVIIIGVIPILLIGIGIFIWVRRRRK